MPLSPSLSYDSRLRVEREGSVRSVGGRMRLGSHRTAQPQRASGDAEMPFGQKKGRGHNPRPRTANPFEACLAIMGSPASRVFRAPYATMGSLPSCG